MKDIKQYFANGKNIVDKETDTDLSNVKEDQEQEDIIATCKRKRVKIRISSNGSSSRMCIIENKNDLIDKTPSPFNDEINNGQRTLQDGTPKSSLTESGVKRRLKKVFFILIRITVDVNLLINLYNWIFFIFKLSKSTVEINENQSEERNISQEQELNNQIVMNLDSSLSNSVNSKDKIELNIEFHDEIGSQREESNAFQVLMSHSKPIQYKSPLQQPIEDSENKKKLDAKEFRSRCKEKLIALADKKGYSTKKIAEMEEGEKIEKNIENRIRFFKGESKSNIHKKDKDSFELSIKTNKQSGNLLDYFSKSPLGLTSKDEKCVSTFTVKADVHRTDNSDIEPMKKPKSNKKYSNKKCPKSSELDLSAMDDIHVIESENLFSLQTVKQDKQKREKPRWSLRIKLHTSEDNDSLYSNDTDDELFSPRSKSKFNASSKSGKSINIDNEVYMKNHNRHVKMKERNKERKELIVKDSNISNIVKDAPNGDTDFKKSNRANKKEQKINDMNEMVTATDDSEYEISNENILKRKPNEKLAPLFIKRRKIDPAVTAAKRLFLQSDIINVENKNTDYKINNGISVLPFPAISHITQLEDELNSIRSEIEHKFSMKIFEKKYLPSIDISNYKYITNCREASKTIKTIKGPVKANVEQVLSEIEKLYPGVRRMWETISTIKGDLEKNSPSPKGRKTHERKRMLTENVEKEEKQSHNCAWTYKYKPMSAQEIVGNEEGANKLKNWLSGWRASLTKENDDSSGDEFYSSDCSSSSNIENNQIAVLLGPHGSGKSASVYVIAEELGYSVIEVNASSKRTGKRILKELEEATKSHRIKKSKHKSLFEQITNEDEISKISQNSLILLEDIDLVFEEDEGFVSAAYQLASNTKRPIVMTCRNTCPHLNKMAPQQNKVYFHKVSGNRASTLLELIALAETGYRIPHNCLRKLLQEGDLRQALLQLQYLLLSAEDLDSLSLMSSLIDVEDTTLDMSEEKTQPNLSLAENMSFYSALHDLNADIANFINNQILYKNFDANEHVQNQSNIILRKQLKQGVDLALSYVTSTCLDRRIMALDYLPTARTICRAEESRSSTNYKRGNRFFHYLHSLKLPSASMKPNILAAACRMLQEGANKTASMSTENIIID
ncbi:ATPase family AAA domain-containing protein 5 [Trachymyrmex zeteki]|uniref:ATPase family AAA domain-containing protein 5 n=1 Tax=Mycetomoellerius zeteki TaxID=64791 RepID=A0A151X870_9HYME|nr:ATPase family AAA domain-containing protein 5 [Trachymyrmex zeteki]